MKKTRTFKRILSLFAIMMMLFSLMAVSVSAGTASDAKESVVTVISQDGMGQGSGFAIGKVGEPVQFIVTNNHVVEGQYNTMATVAFDLASNDYVVASIFLFDVEKDLAVLKLPQATEKRKAMVLCPMKYVDPDDDFAALGYPGNQVTDWPKYNKDDITVTKGGIKKMDRIDGQDVYMLDLDITHGNSGGPLVNSKGEVVGINTFGIGDNNYALAIDELISIIDRDRIPVTLHGEKADNTMLYLIIGGAALVVIIILIIILSSRKKSKAPKAAYATPAAPAAPAGMPVTAAVEPTPAAPVAPAGAGARITAIGGTLNGKRFNVTGSVKMGRDASRCAIAFPVSTQGVSAVHCEVSFDGSVCYLKDLNSSYGTFTVDGNRLVPNSPKILKAGDKFYLASPENTFEVRF